MVELKQELIQKLTQKVTPQLITYQQLLLLPLLELHTEIEKEVEQNPALELTDAKYCSICNEELKKGICVSCTSQSGMILRKEEVKMLEVLSQGNTKDFSPAKNEEDTKVIPVMASVTLNEFLSMNFNLLTDDEELKTAGEILIGNLNENGYLAEDLQQVSEQHSEIQLEVLEEALKLLQKLDPPGIGARNPRECLLLQIETLKEEMEVNPYVEIIIKNFFTELGAKKINEIAKTLKADVADIEQAEKFIHDNLNPYPAKAFHLNWEENNQQSGVLQSPDIIIKEIEGEFKVEILQQKIPIRISPIYLKIYEEIRSNSKKYTEEEKEHLQHYLTRAKVFLKSIGSRFETIQRIADFVVEKQKEYLQTKEKKKLLSLTQAQVSSELAISESTVSRATSTKVVQLPWGELVYFSFFFDFSLRFKEMLREILDKEDSVNPLSDKEISKIFSERGIKLARRTIAKYREEMNLPSSDKRRRIKNKKEN